MSNLQKIGLAARMLRKAAGLTQVVLAGKINLTQAQISHIEKGVEMDLSNLPKIAAACGYQMEIRLKPTKTLQNKPSIHVMLST